MTIRFQADADLNQIILLALLRREPAIDFQTATAANLAGIEDQEVLAIAAGEGRILATHDQKTMPWHFSEFISTKNSPGVIIVPQHLSIADAAEELLLIWGTTEPEEWLNRICFLPL